jgi:2-methylisocitrate lyase-like PEP mutase family enzyme
MPENVGDQGAGRLSLRIGPPAGGRTAEGATVASTVTYLLPMVTIVVGVTALSEHATLSAIAGVVLILVGVAFTRQRAKPTEHPVRVEKPREGQAWDDVT